ncbi:MAG: hypothetical protein JSR69_14040 [Proteobacteria bacterium]|nr:hypothetical protein [Pseudomonadota bacterium]
MSASHQKSTLDAWAFAFDLAESAQGLDLTHEVTDMLVATTRELRSMRALLADFGVPESLLSYYVTYPEQAMTATNLSAPWGTTISNYMKDEVMLSFAWYSYVLPEEASTTTDEELSALKELLVELEEALKAPGLPRFIVDTISKHLEGIRRAIRLCPVQGTKPMKDAARALITDIQIDQDEIRSAAENADETAMNRLAGGLYKVWKKTAEVAGDAEKVIKTGQHLLEIATKVIDKLN